MTNKNHARILLGAIAALGLSAPSAFAVAYTIEAGSLLDWNTAASWTPSGTPGSAVGDTATVSGAFGGVSKTVDISATPTNAITALTLGDTSGLGTTTISASGGSSLLLSAATISSLGTVGAVNTISAPISLTGTNTFSNTATNSLTLSGNVTQTTASTISNQMTTGGASLTIGSGASSVIQTSNLTLTFNNTTSATGVIPSSTVINTVIAGTGAISFGGNQNPAAVYTIKQAQTTASTITINRNAYVLDADNAFGTGQLVTANSNNANIGGELQSTDDSRVLGNALVRLSNTISVTGAHSLTIPGSFYQSNSRVLGNNLATGKALFLNGLVGLDGAAANTNVNNGRSFTVDGTGRTVINGQLVNEVDLAGNVATVGTNDGPAISSIIKRGSGRLELNNALNTIKGSITSSGGLVVFGVAGSYGAASSIVANAAGGVSYAPGTADSAGFATFAGKLLGGTGFLALPAADANANLNFTTTLAAAPNLSVASDGDMTYTGTVTPNATAYNWGGTSGKLTLGANAGTGARNVNYTNGGTVAVNGSPDYTGVTTVSGVVLVSTQNQIAAKANVNSGTGTQNINLTSTLEVVAVSDAGVASSLGASSNAASNLVLNNGTLRHTGADNSSTDRLFTIGTGGATLESTGTGAVTFGSAGGANVTSGAGARTLTLGGTNTGANTIGSNLTDGTLGTDKLAVTKTGAGKWVVSGANTYTGATTISAGTFLVNGSIGASVVTVASGATLGGSGTIGGATSINGILSPGNSPGLLTFSSSLALNSGSTSLFEIEGTDRGVTFDATNVGGQLTLGGALSLSFDSVITPGSYDLFDFGTQVGDFTSVSVGGTFAESMIGSAVITPGIGWTWSSAVRDYAFVNSTGVLSIGAAIPEPSTYALLAGLVTLAGCAIRRRRQS